MDYIGAFSNLKTSSIYDKRSPHKAILLLSIIEMYEICILSDNVIKLDDKLRDSFRNMWNKITPNEDISFPEVYVPFWHMQAEDFWHFVPIRGKEDVLELMKDPNVTPSDIKLRECVDYAELDEDLYFLMTIQTGRSSLKRALLENYTNLPIHIIDEMSVSIDNFTDNSQNALKEYEDILKTSVSNNISSYVCDDKEVEKQFLSLNEDVQYIMNIEYYSFLKNHYNERDLFKEICPTVFDLFDRITNNPIYKTDLSPSLAIIYENFLSNLKISLMSEEGTFDLIDKINNAINILTEFDFVSTNIDLKESENLTIIQQPLSHNLAENEKVIDSQKEELQIVVTSQSSKNDSEIIEPLTHELSTKKEVIEIQEETPLFMKAVSPLEGVNSESNLQPQKTTENRRNETPWTGYEEELITLYYKQGYSLEQISTAIGRAEFEIKKRLVNLGIIEDQIFMDYYVENSSRYCYILNRKGENVYMTNGKFKIFNGKIYRFNYKDMCFTVKSMELVNDKWDKGSKKLVAYERTSLFSLLDKYRFIEQIEDFQEGETWTENRICVEGKWFDYKGNIIESNSANHNQDVIYIKKCDYEPKGKIIYLIDIAESSYDFLWMLAIVDFMKGKQNSTYLNFDKIACMMIANAWEILSEFEPIKSKEISLVNCINFLIDESQKYMPEKLSWESSKELIYNSIKDYPMAGVFEDTVDELLNDAPYSMLRPWIRVDDRKELVMYSVEFRNSSLYAIHLLKNNSYIEINPNWRNYFHNENDNLKEYFKYNYLKYLTSTI